MDRPSMYVVEYVLPEPVWPYAHRKKACPPVPSAVLPSASSRRSPRHTAALSAAGPKTLSASYVFVVMLADAQVIVGLETCTRRGGCTSATAYAVLWFTTCASIIFLFCADDK
jgi:hypothetical protein